MKCLAAAAIALLIATPALAQQAPATDANKQTPPAAAQNNPQGNQPASAANEQANAGKFITAENPDQWLVGNMWDKSVYDASGKSIGSLNDILVGPDGKIQALVVGVGGFLGLGEKNVALDYDLIKKNGGITPNKIVVSMTEQELRNAPAFKRSGAAK